MGKSDLWLPTKIPINFYQAYHSSSYLQLSYDTIGYRRLTSYVLKQLSNLLRLIEIEVLLK